MLASAATAGTGGDSGGTALQGGIGDGEASARSRCRCRCRAGCGDQPLPIPGGARRAEGDGRGFLEWGASDSALPCPCAKTLRPGLQLARKDDDWLLGGGGCGEHVDDDSDPLQF